MLIDITLKITPSMAKESAENTNPSLVGHMGTHFDVMEETFPLSYTERKGIVFDVSSVKDRDIEVNDIPFEDIKEEMFVAFYTGFVDKVPYGTKEYFSTHPQLSCDLVEKLLEKKTSIIAIDCGGIRRGKEHVPIDRHCAEQGTFVIENLCHLDRVLQEGGRFIARTFPVRYEGVTGLPCRVIAEI